MIYNIYTDGSCNQGSHTIAINNGGWAFLVVNEDSIIINQESEFEIDTTNNRCEMIAIIKSLMWVKKERIHIDSKIIVNCDSAYIVNAFEDKWIQKWEKNGWKNSQGEDVSNRDCWVKIISLSKECCVTFNKVKRKSNVFAKRVDFLAREKMRS